MKPRTARRSRQTPDHETPDHGAPSRGRALGVAGVFSAASAIALVAAACACSSDEPPAAKVEPTSLRTRQETVDLAVWNEAVATDAGLATLTGGQNAPLLIAGVIEDDAGRTLLWAEYAAGPDAPRAEVSTVFRLCLATGACSRGTGTYTPTGIALQDEDGAAIEHIAIGAPVLLKLLKNHNYQKLETELAPLSRKHVVTHSEAAADLALLPFGKRRLVLLNAYGAAVGVSMTAVADAFVKRGVFDEILAIDFVRRGDVDGLLRALTPLDIVVWLGAGVQEPFSDAPPKSVGLTVSRGIFGDAFYQREYAKLLFEAPALGGAGLIVLAGSNTLAEDFEEQTGIFAGYLHQAPQRPVVGFDGILTSAQAQAAAIALIDSLLGGNGLADALEAATTAAAATARTTIIEEQRAAWKLPQPQGPLWAAPPSSSHLKVYVKTDPACVSAVSTCNEDGYKQGQQQGKTVAPTELTAYHAEFDCDVQWAGSYFTCSRQDATLKLDFKAWGVVLGLDVGDRFFVYLAGDAGPGYKGLAVVGEGVVESTDVGGGETSVAFTGVAAASTYVDAENRCCVAKSPLLQGVKAQAGLLTFKP